MAPMTERNDDTDHYLLNDTLLGRIAQSLMMGAFVATPDFFKGRLGRKIARTAIFSSGVVASAVLNKFDGKEHENPKRVAKDLGKVIELDSPLKTWGLLGGGLGAFIGSSKLQDKINDRIVKILTKRGVVRPNLALGVATAVAMFVQSERNARKKGKK